MVSAEDVFFCSECECECESVFSECRICISLHYGYDSCGDTNDSFIGCYKVVKIVPKYPQNSPCKKHEK